MPMHNVFVEWIIRRQIVATAKPPDRILSARVEKTKIRVRRWDIGITRVQDQRYADCLKLFAGKFRTVFRRGCWHLLTENMRKTDARLLKNPPIRQHATLATTTGGTLPAVMRKLSLTIQLLQLGANAILQGQQIVFYLVDIAQNSVLVLARSQYVPALQVANF